MLRLGTIEFSDLELPEEINQGGKQSIAVHAIMGGKRVVDAMGPDDEPIEWQGRLFGESAALRALQLDLLRRSGRQVELEFGLRAYKVVVHSFVAKMQQPTIYTYAIGCTIVEDLIAGDGGKESEDIEAQVAADIAMVDAAAAANFAIIATLNFVTNLILNPQTGAIMLRNAGYAALGAVREALGGGVLIAADAAGAAATRMLNAPGDAGVEPGGEPEDMAVVLNNTADASEEAYDMQIAEAGMTRMRANVEEVPQ